MTAVNAVPARRGGRPGTWFRLEVVEPALVPVGHRRHWRVSWVACSCWWSRRVAADRLHWRKSAQRESGAVAVEAALVLPLIMTMLLGIIDLGLSVHANVGSAAAVRAGARGSGTVGADRDVPDSWL